MNHSIYSRLNRRQAVRLIGVAGINLLGAGRSNGGLLPARSSARSGAMQVSFPEGAVIRTIFSDLSPDALAHGPTLFHEHLDGVYSRETRQFQLPPPSSADIAPPYASPTSIRNGLPRYTVARRVEAA